MTIEYKEAKEDNVWKPEDIVSSETNIKETIVPYGNSQDMLVPGLHYPKPTSSSPYSNSVSYTTTGVKTITGVGFKPSIIKIKANTSTSFSDGIYDGTGVKCTYVLLSGSPSVGRIGYSCYVDTAGNVSITTTIVPTLDGFTINVTNIFGTLLIDYECYP